MNREILFRGKRLDNKGWVYGYFVESEQDIYRAYIVVSARWKIDDLSETEVYEVDPSTVGQYTGLTDKNGVKIFEGDLVEAGYYKWKCEVVWDKKCARFICYTLKGERKIVYVDMEDKNGLSVIKIIGNIYGMDSGRQGEDGCKCVVDSQQTNKAMDGKSRTRGGIMKWR